MQPLAKTLNGRDGAWRPDIEGFRAFAIIPVLLFHFDASLLSGGFLGVDVFFVISGYLIAKILCSPNRHASTDSLKFFILRRFLRIFPTVSIVFAVFSVVFSFYLIPGVHDVFFLTSLASLFGVSNLFLSYFSVDYFSPESNLNPFLHSWSISIEDQFYIFFSILIFFSYKLFDESFKKHVMFVALVLLVVGFFYSPASSEKYFYMPFSRFWQFFVGSLVFFVSATHWFEKGIKRLAEPLFLFSLMLLIWLFFSTDENSIAYIQYVAVTIVSGIILLCSDKLGRLSSMLLENRISRSIGLLSFSLYVIHFPVLKLIEYYFDTDKNNIMSFMLYVFLISLLSFLNFNIIENYFISRYRSVDSVSNCMGLFKKALSILIVSAGLIGASYLFLNPNLSFSKEYSDRLSVYKTDGFVQEGQHSLIVLGESHAQQFFPALQALNFEKNISLIDKTGSACFFSTDLNYSHYGKVETRCTNLVNDVVSGIIDSPESDVTLFVATRSLFYISPAFVSAHGRRIDGLVKSGVFYSAENYDLIDMYFSSLRETLVLLEDTNAKMVFLAPLPEMKTPTFSCLFNPRKEECYLPKSINLEYRKEFVFHLKKLSAQFANFYVWDPIDLICFEGFCPNIHNELIIYRDDNHLSKEMAFSLKDDLWKVLEKTFDDD